MKKHLLILWSDVKSETPKIYKWICAVLLSLSGSAGAAAIAYNNLPPTWQAAIPQQFIVGLAAISLVGSAVAKKQNIQ